MSEIKKMYRIVSPEKKRSGIDIYLTERGWCWTILALDSRAISLWHDDIDDCLQSLDLVMADMAINADKYNDLKHPLGIGEIETMCQIWDDHTQRAPSGWRIDLAAHTGSTERIVRDYDKTIWDPPVYKSRKSSKPKMAIAV